ncbi:hypothetical protein ABT174_30350 [Streptomyces sparsogenes]|uniref:hypothetical protein n=1 Tax=Streptomyces sparsogenes TaxID=67365 RepID=UPI00332AF7E5
MADHHPSPPHPRSADRRVVSPTLVTPGPQPVELAGSAAAEEPQVLRGEVVGPRHARRRPVSDRRKAAAGAILLSATGAATALFLMLGKDGREATAAPARDAPSSAPDAGEDDLVPVADSAAGAKPLPGASRTAPPAAAEAPAAQPRAQAPSRAPAHTSPPTRTGPSHPSWPSRWGGSGDGRWDSEEAARWAQEWADRYGSGDDGRGGSGYDGSGYDGSGHDGYGRGGRHHGGWGYPGGGSGRR